MRQNKWIWLILTVLTFGALLVRVWQLDHLPNGLNRDEAALGYNAYLLSKTAGDEWGQPWPVNLRSFGDYKLAGSAWAMIPFIKLLGFSNWAVRLPIALAGTALVPLIYLLCRRIGLGQTSSLIPAALMAFSPIFIFFSRFGFEAILALAISMASIVLLLQKRSTVWSDTLAALLFFLACLTYNTPLLLTPVFLGIVMLHRGLLMWKKWWTVVVLFLLAAVTAYWLVAPGAASKQAITIFSDPTIAAHYPEYRSSFSGMSQKILGNKTMYYAELTAERFANFFSPKFLVSSGGSHPWHQVPNASSHLVLPSYLAAMGAVAFAIVSVLLNYRMLLSKKVFRHSLFEEPSGRFLILLSILLIALVLPSVTVDAPHATRSLFGVVALFILVGATVSRVSSLFIDKKRLAVAVGFVFVLIFTWYTGSYVVNYFTTYGEKSLIATRSGLTEVISEHEAKTTPVVVVDPDGYEYIRVAWSESITASDFLNTIQRESPNTLGFTPATQVGRYTFVRSIEAVPPGTHYYAWNGASWEKLQ